MNAERGTMDEEEDEERPRCTNIWDEHLAWPGTYTSLTRILISFTLLAFTLFSYSFLICRCMDLFTPSTHSSAHPCTRRTLPPRPGEASHCSFVWSASFAYRLQYVHDDSPTFSLSLHVDKLLLPPSSRLCIISSRISLAIIDLSSLSFDRSI